MYPDINKLKNVYFFADNEEEHTELVNWLKKTFNLSCHSQQEVYVFATHPFKSINIESRKIFGHATGDIDVFNNYVVNFSQLKRKQINIGLSCSLTDFHKITLTNHGFMLPWRDRMFPLEKIKELISACNRQDKIISKVYARKS